MKLKDKIIDKTIELFNERGIASTSPNQIAKALDISAGNLTYHYKTKAMLVDEAYRKMLLDSEDFIKITGYLTLNDFRKMMEKFQVFKKRYNFFFNDIAYIVRNFPEVGKAVESANSSRFKKARLMFQHYIDTGRMIPEDEGINYDFLIHNVWSVAAFWDIQSKIITPHIILQRQMDMVDMTWYMILPYLTNKGKEEYDQINAFLGN